MKTLDKNRSHLILAILFLAWIIGNCDKTGIALP